ncbi:M15 family metallopeptidase [Kitasatospora sp. LaBMicrA B282]|uniref:M15 family metallopeptidase n=1 Tax=Kitasatospora sp. LaBMicrA B282 TaxID=3420949 RepID=UPI003D1478BC
MIDVRSTAIPRRRVLGTGLGLAGGVALWAAGSAGPARAAEPGAPAAPAAPLVPWRGDRSANGWPVLATAPSRRIEGAGEVSLALADGAPTTVLLHVARRFHYEVRALTQDQATGHRSTREVAADYESNHLSGTAIALCPQLYPVRAAGGLFPYELLVVRDILADLEGVVRWGGDEPVPKESHFQLDVPPDHPDLGRVAAKLRGWADQPGQGAGTADPLAPGRLPAAAALAERTGAGPATPGPR